MSDALLASLITGITSIAVALINRPKKSDSKEDPDSQSEKLKDPRYTYSLRMFYFIIFFGAFATFMAYSYFNTKDELANLQSTSQVNLMDSLKIYNQLQQLVKKEISNIPVVNSGTRPSTNSWTIVPTSINEFNIECDYKFQIKSGWDTYIGAIFYPGVIRRTILTADYGGNHTTAIKIGDIENKSWMSRSGPSTGHGAYPVELWCRCP